MLRLLSPLFGLAAWLAIAPRAAHAATLTCIPAATPEIVHGEGITERTGDIVFVCSGGGAGATYTVNLFFFLNVDITNRLTSVSSNTSAGISLTADNGSGPQPIAAPPTRAGGGTLVFNGATFTLSPTGTVTLRLAGLRGAANELNFDSTKAMQVLIGLEPSTVLDLPTNQLVVGRPEHGLYIATSGQLVCTQSGSPLAADITSFASFLASGAAFNSTRVTEGFAASFGPKSDPQNLNADTGTRIWVYYSGFPAGARLFVPTVVAGSDATQPTAGGNLGVPASGGKYTPGPNSSLLLSFVPNTDLNGAGGTPVYLPGPSGSGTVTFDSMSEVTLSNGGGEAVYEVVDANLSIQESAQFPTFLSIAPSGSGASTETLESISLGPVTTIQTATATVTDPIPRFERITPPADCTLLGDCNAQYFPTLSVQVPPLSYTAAAGGNTQTQYFSFVNQAGGLLQWTITVNYLNGSGWLNISPTSGNNNGDVRVDAVPGSLAPGTYQAIITVNAGPLAGSQEVAVTFVVTAPSAPKAAAIQSAVNAATFVAGPVAPGSIATLTGSGFSGQNLSVTFDGLAGQVLFSNDTQINVVVPAGLSAQKTSAQAVVSVGGLASAPFSMSLAPFAPGIFANGVLNQDNSLNSSKQPAVAGSVIQIYATGLSGSGAITAKIGSQTVSQPYYAGPAPGLAGVQQVDLILPADLTGNTVNVSVCGGSTVAQAVCSPAVSVAISE